MFGGGPRTWDEWKCVCRPVEVLWVADTGVRVIYVWGGLDDVAYCVFILDVVHWYCTICNLPETPDR